MQKLPKQPNQVRGNRIGCINFQMCPLCYGCRAFDSRDPECRTCELTGHDGSKRNFNICNKNLHEEWKVNKMVCKNKVMLDSSMQISSWERS